LKNWKTQHIHVTLNSCWRGKTKNNRRESNKKEEQTKKHIIGFSNTLVSAIYVWTPTFLFLLLPSSVSILLTTLLHFLFENRKSLSSWIWRYANCEFLCLWFYQILFGEFSLLWWILFLNLIFVLLFSWFCCLIIAFALLSVEFLEFDFWYLKFEFDFLIF